MKSNPSLQAVLCAPALGRARNRTQSNTTATAAPPTLGASRLMDFCRRYKISRWTFRNMKRNDTAPRTFNIGLLLFISHQAEAEWLREREAASAGRTVRKICK